MVELNELIEKIVKKEDGVYIKLKKESYEAFLTQIDFRHIDKELLSELIATFGIDNIRNTLTNFYWFEDFISEMDRDTLKAVIELGIIEKEDIFKKLKKNPPIEIRDLKKLSNTIEIPEEFWRRRIEYLINNAWVQDLVEELAEIKDLEVCREALNKEKVINIILKELDWLFRDLIVGRGSFFENAIEFIKNLSELKDLLNEENKKKIEEFFVSRIEEIRKMIKNRCKKEWHREYIKALIYLLPDNFRKEFLICFI